MRTEEPDVTVVVPTYNLSGKIAECIASLEELDREVAVEIIFVDDASTDGTKEIADAACRDRPRWTVLTTGAPSGSPSRPRNIGLDASTGRWVFFLDGDDSIAADAVRDAVVRGDAEGWDVVRGSVQVWHTGAKKFTVDRIPDFKGSGGTVSPETVAERQSLTCSALYRRQALLATGVRFDEQVRMGEDLAFTAKVLTTVGRLGYVDTPLFTYIKRNTGARSAMHSMGNREARELAVSWELAERAFAGRGSSYLALHGSSTLGYALRQFIRHASEPLDRDGFGHLSGFFQKYSARIRGMRFDRRAGGVVEALLGGDHEAFLLAVKPRLLIAGHDLKFIKGAAEALGHHFNVDFDEWPSERVHDANTSNAKLEWADLIWCEWLTQCAVWYSQRVQPHQRMVTRLHRYELGRTYGYELNREAVDAVITIAPHCLEDAIARFGFPRSQVRYIPNYYDEPNYEQADSTDELRRFRLAIVGIVPRRKGFLRALQLLRELRDRDDRYTLSVLGSAPSAYGWVAGDPEEMAYFASCDEYIDRHGLEPYVHYLGWVDVRARAREFGTILSMSDGEGCHIGPGEAFLAGNEAAVLRWRGAEFIYPEQYVFDSVRDMADAIAGAHWNEVEPHGRAHFTNQFSLDVFVRRVTSLWQEIAQ